jgi:hypothetical protein
VDGRVKPGHDEKENHLNSLKMLAALWVML